MPSALDRLATLSQQECEHFSSFEQVLEMKVDIQNPSSVVAKAAAIEQLRWGPPSTQVKILGTERKGFDQNAVIKRQKTEVATSAERKVPGERAKAINQKGQRSHSNRQE